MGKRKPVVSSSVTGPLAAAAFRLGYYSRAVRVRQIRVWRRPRGNPGNFNLPEALYAIEALPATLAGHIPAEVRVELRATLEQLMEWTTRIFNREDDHYYDEENGCERRTAAGHGPWWKPCLLVDDALQGEATLRACQLFGAAIGEFELRLEEGAWSEPAGEACRPVAEVARSLTKHVRQVHVIRAIAGRDLPKDWRSLANRFRQLVGRKPLGPEEDEYEDLAASIPAGVRTVSEKFEEVMLSRELGQAQSNPCDYSDILRVSLTRAPTISWTDERSGKIVVYSTDKVPAAVVKQLLQAKGWISVKRMGENDALLTGIRMARVRKDIPGPIRKLIQTTKQYGPHLKPRK